MPGRFVSFVEPLVGLSVWKRLDSISSKAAANEEALKVGAVASMVKMASKGASSLKLFGNPSVFCGCEGPGLPKRDEFEPLLTERGIHARSNVANLMVETRRESRGIVGVLRNKQVQEGIRNIHGIGDLSSKGCHEDNTCRTCREEEEPREASSQIVQLLFTKLRVVEGICR